MFLKAFLKARALLTGLQSEFNRLATHLRMSVLPELSLCDSLGEGHPQALAIESAGSFLEEAACVVGWGKPREKEKKPASAVSVWFLLNTESRRVGGCGFGLPGRAVQRIMFTSPIPRLRQSDSL